ncbi:MAG: Crp/Fnr family transcriptional regulator [Alphaproteobacteria bacterium]|nr:Crp/Fnr family transcriptional regulator [Alphaproteobacteria bacterium]MBM3624017.1 Crp/Fnr family transcriptional regulator [Alphaproteobacteria bacterium]
MMRPICCASEGCASLTIDTSPAAQGYGAGQRKGRAVRRASRAAGPGELRKALLFAEVDGGTLSRLSADVRIESLQDGDLLFRQGSGVAHLSFVLSGYVKLMRTAPSGRQTLIGIRSDGEMIGEAPMGADEIHTVSAESVGAARVLKLPAPRFARLLKESPALCAAVMRDSKASIARLVGEIEALKSQNADQRLAHFILSLCPPGEDRCRFRLPYDKRLIAARLGVKQETLSRAFAKLRAHGVRTETRNVQVESVTHLADQYDRLGRAGIAVGRSDAEKRHDAA